MNKSIKVKTVISILNSIILIYYTTGTAIIEKINLQIINTGIKYLTYIMFIYSIIYFFKKLFFRKIKFLKSNFLPILFSCSVLLLTLISNSFNISLIKDSMMLIGTAFYSIYLINYYEVEDLLSLIIKVEFIIGIFSVLFTILFPEYGKHFYEGQLVWRGAFLHKNLLGANMAFNIIVSLACFTANRHIISRRFLVINILLSVGLIILTNSVTSLIISIIPFLVYQIYKRFRVKLNPVYGVVLLHTLVYYLINNKDKYNHIFMRLFNRNLTLTGRTDIWKAVTDVIKEQYTIGYGYRNLWSEDSMLAYIIRDKVKFNVTGSHNGILEWMLMIGIVGVIFLFVIFFISGRAALKLIKNQEVIASFLIQYIFYIGIFYISERLTDPLSYQVLMIFISIGIGGNYKRILRGNEKI